MIPGGLRGGGTLSNFRLEIGLLKPPMREFGPSPLRRLPLSLGAGWRRGRQANKTMFRSAARYSGLRQTAGTGGADAKTMAGTRSMLLPILDQSLTFWKFKHILIAAVASVVVLRGITEVLPLGGQIDF